MTARTMSTVDPAVVTLADAAKTLGIGQSTAYDLAKKGEFPVPVLRVGRSMKVSRRALAHYIDGDLADTSNGMDAPIGGQFS